MQVADAPKGTLEGDRAEVQRLKSTGPGVDQVQNPTLRGIGKVADVLGGILAPGLTAKIPGTTLHNQVLLGQANKAVTGDEANAEKEAQTGLQTAQAGAVPSEIAEREATTAKTQQETENLKNPVPKVGLTPEEQTYNDLLGSVNPDTGKNYTHAEALKAIKEVGQEVKPEIQPHITYDSGIPVSVTGSKGTWDVNDPKLPEELKPLVQAAIRAHGQHTQEDAEKQARAFAAAAARSGDSATRKDVAAHDKAYVQPAEATEKSYQMMDHAYKEYEDARKQGKELPTGAQSMLALSTHLATTFGNVKGSRVTKDMIAEHLGARSISDDALVAFQKLTNGDKLSPAQWDAFHDLIKQSRNLSWGTAVKEAARKKIPIDFLPTDLQDRTVNGEHYALGEDGQYHKVKGAK